MTSLYYDREGRPIDSHECEEHFADLAYKHVRATLVGDAHVSTVWLGIDHSFGLGGPPLIFETMVFGGPCAGEQERYPTIEAADAGHERWVAALRERVEHA